MLSGGEKFVAINLLSKIGVVFVIASVIAFSAASEGHIPNLVRLILVLTVGLLMLGTGELFRWKGSKVFSSTMIFGGVAELMICAPVGRYGLHIFDNCGMLIYSVIAAAVGFLFVWRYKSHALLIVMIAASMIPGFALLSSTLDISGVFLPAYLVATHFAAAVISRRCRFIGAEFTGIFAAAIECVLVFGNLVRSQARVYDAGLDYNLCLLITMIFAACCALCYSSGTLLNAAENDGDPDPLDITLLYLVQGGLIFIALTLFISNSAKTAGVVLMILAVLYTIATIAFSLKYWFGCKTNTILINLALISAELALFLLIDAGNWQYIALHSFAAAVLIAGCFLERKLFKYWGVALLCIAELRFFIVLGESAQQPESFKLSAVIINLILWFGIMAVLSTRKIRESIWFRLYTFAALLNAGFLCWNLIASDLMRILKQNNMLLNTAQSSAFSGLLSAAVWMILGFIAGKLPYLKELKAAASMTHYGFGFCCLAWANFANTFSNIKEQNLETMLIIATVIVNAVSVLAVLDITLQIQEKASKFSRAIGLVVSGYAMLTLTTILGTNNVVRFTSCIISIIYLVMAAVWIVIGFRRSNSLLRRFGLALALFSSAKLFLFDFKGVDAFGRTILFIGFGITLLGISFGYAIMEKRLSRREKENEPVDKSNEK